MIRAVMICDYRNPISVAYSKIALKTWEDVRNVEVERFQCYTPDTINDAPFKINWGRYSSAGKYKTTRHEITPTEKACLTSETVLFLLSVIVSTKIATPQGP